MRSPRIALRTLLPPPPHPNPTPNPLSPAGADHDPLDVLVLMQEPVVPFSFLRAKPIGVMQARLA